MRGDRLPVPVRSQLPGPAPASSNTLDRYSWLMDRCMDRNPQRRPSFSDIAEILSEMARAEEMASRTEVPPAPPPPQRQGSTRRGEGGANGAPVCVVCLDEPSSVAFVHARDRE